MADLGSEVLVLPEQAGESSSSSAKRHEQDLPYWSSQMFYWCNRVQQPRNVSSPYYKTLSRLNSLGPWRIILNYH